ncbi:MAG TPA: aldehyde dehydrogenase [Actinomycetota bacterium]|nr:aldehyde dehydrogenase [Actinomycetota bacterium]
MDTPCNREGRQSRHPRRLDTTRSPSLSSRPNDQLPRRGAPTGASASVEGIEVSTEHWIGGERIGSSGAFADVSPIDESTLAEVARGTAEDADRAVDAARAATETWGRTSPKQRGEVLHRIADLVQERVPELAPVETRDNGSLVRSMRNSVMPRVARNFRFFADQLTQLRESFEMDGFESRTEWDPSGVTAVITPWNAPLMLATWRVAPALAAGNSVVLKPPEWAPLTASMLADVTKDAGLPDGAFNVLQGIGEEAGAALTGHPGVDRIAFTGSIETGKLVARAAAANLTPTSLELGGKSPFVAFADADMDAVVKQAVNQFDNAGQVCLAGTRLILERSMADVFLERFLEAAAALRQGDPREETTDLGPQITREHLERVDGFVRRAKAEGATAILGGGPNEELGGLYYRPTLFTDVPAGAEVLRKEVFGPVLTLQTFEEEEEAVALGNQTEYGLAAILYTGDRDRAERVAERLVAGTVWVNCFFVRDLRAPFGGARRSGVGREGGVYSFDFYADVKNVCTAPWPQAAER